VINKPEEKTRAFQAGGVDFVTKPFHLEEVLVRIETHLSIRNLQKQLQQQNELLNQKIKERDQAEKKLRAHHDGLEETITQHTAQLVNTNAQLRAEITERKLAQVSLQKLSSVIEQAADIVVITDKEGLIEFVNPAFEQVTGYQKSEVLGKNPRILKSERQPPEFYEGMWQTILSGHNFSAIIINKKKTGELYHEEKTITPLRDKSNTITHFVSTGKDISTRIQRENALIASEERFRTLTKLAPVGVYLTTPRGDCQYVNERWLAMAGLTFEAAIGQGWVQAIHPADREMVNVAWYQMVASQGAWGHEYRFMTPAGQITWVYGVATELRDDTGQITGYIGVNVDITDRKRIETVLQESEARYRLLAEKAKDIIWQVDIVEERVVYLSPASQHILGYTPAEMIATPLIKHLKRLSRTSRKNTQRYITELINAGSTPQVEISYVSEVEYTRRDGQTIWLESNIHPLFDDAGDFKGVMGISRDVTDRKLAEQAQQEHKQFLSALNEIVRAALQPLTLPQILQQLANSIGELFGADSAYLDLWDEPTQTAIPSAAFGKIKDSYTRMTLNPGEASLTKSVLEVGRPLTTQDIRKSPLVSRRLATLLPDCSLLGLPLIAGEQKLGAVIIGYNTPHPFSPTETARGQQVANQISLAIAKSRLLEETKLRWREAETLRLATSAITKSFNLSHRMDIILEQLRQVVTYDSATVQLLRHNHMEIVNSRGMPEPAKVLGLTFPLKEDNINGLVVHRQQPFIINNARTQEYARFFAPPHQPIGSWLGVPLIAQEKMIGMLTMDSMEPYHFNQEHIRLVVPFANHVASALENAQLFEQTRQDAETKATLLREVNHRVKNNLSAIIGLLYAERRHAGVQDNAIYQEIMDNLISRIRGLSIIHNLLSAAEWAPLSLSTICQQLIKSSQHMIPRGKLVVPHINPSPVAVGAQQATSLALIINELVTNTIKYGLADRDSINLQINISLHKEVIYLEYIDDGPGYPQSILDESQQNLGLYLIKTLVVSGLRGELTLLNNPGANALISFKLIKD
jgi:PAS domain S-box-containing protein